MGEQLNDSRFLFVIHTIVQHYGSVMLLWRNTSNTAYIDYNGKCLEK